MAFWKFGFAPAVNSIDQLLNQLPAPPALPAAGSPTDPVTLPSADLALIESTLDSLLETPDLLSEIKAGSNQRLIDFLARAEVVQRLGGWVLWGLGGEQEEDVPNGGIISDDVQDGKVPDAIVAPGKKKQVGMGNVPRRRDMDEMGVLEGGVAETEQEKTWANFPRLATEILSSESPSLTDILFQPTAASSLPHTCPSPRAFLVPFWETLLRSTELQLETRAILVGFWARVNTALLNGPRGLEVISHITTIPHLLPRLLTLLPNCSPLNDLILLILRIAPSSPFYHSVVPAALRMLDPLNSLGKSGHVAAEELLRGVIELCSAAATPQPGGPGLPPSQVQDGPEWRDNSLTQQLAEERTVRTMVDWMLEGLEEPPNATDVPLPPTPNPPSSRLSSSRPSSPDLPPLPVPDLSELRTSSLVQSISVLVDLIRKNNSDFVEQQMLSWARRKEAEAGDRELMDADRSDASSYADQESNSGDDDKGPSVVDLGALLATVAPRLDGFQKLVKNPRTPHGKISTSAGQITPLTLERFRICEFYAELLHCSNMSLLNRRKLSPALYDNGGFLANGWRSAEALASAISEASTTANGDETEDALEPAGASSPVSGVQTPFSGLSTPASLDTESGILTRDEANAVKKIVAAASEEGDVEVDDEDDDGEDPFGDPKDALVDSVGDLAEATSAINLDEDLRARPSETPDSPASNHSHQDTPPRSQTPIVSRKRRSTKTIPTGQLLKLKFLECRIVNTMLDLFFDFPWNNFLHNVVFDILQQIFHSRLDRPLDRQLALSVFLDAKLIDRIIEGQSLNDAAGRSGTSRLGYMGHMTLIAEEIVKLFEHFPEEIYVLVEPHIPQPDWDRYVATTLRETRERDLSPLGGGIIAGAHKPSSITLSDEDDEFPMAGARRPLDNGLPPGVPAGEAIFGNRGRPASLEDSNAGSPGSGDKFSMYLANAISGDQQDSSDDDEAETDGDGWFASSSRFDPSSSAGRQENKFAFDDQFGSPGPASLAQRTSFDSDDDADWGRAATAISAAAGGFESSFSDSPFDSFAPTTGAEEEDDFGDFESADSPSIVLPSMDALDDFDFDENNRPPVTPPSESSPSRPRPPTLATAPSPARPTFARTATAEDGSALFGGLSSPFDEQSPTSPPKQLPTLPTVPLRRYSSTSSISPPTSPSVQADLATSLEEPLGPSMHSGSQLTSDGFVQTVVEGKTIRVPADEIALAHRRLSIEGQERPVLTLTP